jgi:hypothetical protein
MGKEVVLMGWVQRRRDHGGVIFIDLRDREGITQVVFNPEINRTFMPRPMPCATNSSLASRPGGARPDGMINPKLPTGEIEVMVDELKILNPAKTPAVHDRRQRGRVRTIRLKNRHLDLRRPALQRNIITRHKASASCAAISGRQRVSGHRNAGADPQHAGRRPGLPGAQPGQSRPVLRPAPVAPAVQTAAHDFRVRPLLPDRALLPGRGSAGRPPAGVHPDRYGDVLCGRGRPHGGQRRHDGQIVQRGCQPDAAPAFSPAHLCRGHGSLRAGQTRHPLRSGTQRLSDIVAGSGFKVFASVVKKAASSRP